MKPQFKYREELFFVVRPESLYPVSYKIEITRAKMYLLSKQLKEVQLLWKNKLRNKYWANKITD